MKQALPFKAEVTPASHSTCDVHIITTISVVIKTGRKVKLTEA